MIARDGQHIGDVLLLQPGAQRPVIPIGLVGGHPGERHPRADGPLDHQPGQLRLGRERRVPGNPGRLAAGRVTGPGLRQVQLPVNQRVPARGSIAKVDRDLGVLDPARGAGPDQTAEVITEMDASGLVNLGSVEYNSAQYIATSDLTQSAVGVPIPVQPIYLLNGAAPHAVIIYPSAPYVKFNPGIGADTFTTNYATNWLR